MQNSLQNTIQLILETFPPISGGLKVARKQNYWRILKSLTLNFADKTFAINDLFKCINKNNGQEGEKISPTVIVPILEALKTTHLIDEPEAGLYKMSSKTAEGLAEFFGFMWRPKGGKTGFLKYLLDSNERVMLWYCLYKKYPISEEEALAITGFELEKCQKYLENFRANNLIELAQNVGTLPKKGNYETNVYRILETKKEKIFLERLWGEYFDEFCPTKTILAERVFEIMTYYDKISGKKILQELKSMNIHYSPSAVHKVIRGLAEGGVIRRKGKRKQNRGGFETFYSIDYEHLGNMTDSKLKLKTKNLMN